jgi:hypothetical protein
MRDIEREILVEDLERLVRRWRKAGLWTKWAIGHAIACKVSYRLPTLIAALRGVSQPIGPDTPVGPDTPNGVVEQVIRMQMARDARRGTE